MHVEHVRFCVLAHALWSSPAPAFVVSYSMFAGFSQFCACRGGVKWSHVRVYFVSLATVVVHAGCSDIPHYV